MKKKTKKMIGLGLGLVVGAGVAGSVGDSLGADPGVTSNVGAAFRIGSLALPIMAADMVMDSTKELTGSKKKKKSKYLF